MFSFFKSNPLKKLKKQHSVLLEKAMNAQRNGDIRNYSQLSLETDTLYKEIERIEAEQKQNL